jgi:hypothetical protein
LATGSWIYPEEQMKAEIMKVMNLSIENYAREYEDENLSLKFEELVGNWEYAC